MKILMVTMGLDIGGAETHIVELSKQLKAMGHDVAVVSNGGVYVSEITAAGIRHYQAPLHRRELGCMRRARAILKTVISEEQPDVVHAHARIPAFLCGTLYKRMKFPFVTTAHGVFDTTGILRHLTNWGERTLAVSDDIKAYIIREYGAPESRISVTINGIDTEKFSPDIPRARILRELHLDGDKPIISHISRLEVNTSLVARQLIEIAPRLDAALPGVQLLIVGGGTMFETVQAEADAVNRTLGRPCVVMTGPRTDVNEILAAGDVSVGVSRSALEAMATAKPVIVAGNEGSQGLFGPEKLAEARQGNFCCRGLGASAPERLLADLLDVFSRGAAEWARLGAYGRQVILDDYSVRRMTQDCLDMYEQVRRRKYSVLMSGYYGFDNAGDDAILQSIFQSIREASGEVAVIALSKHPRETRERYGMEALPRLRLLKILWTLRRCDALLSGGGSLLQDRTSTRSLLYYLLIIRMAAWRKKPVMLYANGIGPVLRPVNRRRVRKTVEQAAVVTLRDHSSERELREMGVRREDLHVTADPVFRLEAADEARADELLRAASLPAGRPFAAVAVREWPGNAAFTGELAALCDHLRQSCQMEILFVLMQPNADRRMSQRVREQMREPSFLLDGTRTPQELMRVLGRARLCVTMRLHTLIFAARMSVPALGIVYDPKVESYLQELGMPSAGDVRHFRREEAIAQADRLMAAYEEYHARMAERSRALAAAASENERLLLELLEHQE